MENKAFTTFALNPHASMSAHTATVTDKTDFTAPTLPKFLASLSTYEFYHTAAKQLDTSGAEFKLDKQGVTV